MTHSSSNSDSQYKPKEFVLLFFPLDVQDEIMDWAIEHGMAVKDGEYISDQVYVKYKYIILPTEEDELAFRLKYHYPL